MTVIATGQWLWATHLRRAALYLCVIFVLWDLVCLVFSVRLPPIGISLLHWIPMAALFTSRTSRDLANTVWVAAAIGGAAVGLGLLGNNQVWFSVAACAFATTIAYTGYTRRIQTERSTGSVAPESCWLRVSSGLVPVEVAPGLDCQNCGHPHIYFGFSAFGRVELGAPGDAVIEVEPPEVPVVIVVFTDAEGRRWLVPRP